MCSHSLGESEQPALRFVWGMTSLFGKYEANIANIDISSDTYSIKHHDHWIILWFLPLVSSLWQDFRQINMFFLSTTTQNDI